MSLSTSRNLWGQFRYHRIDSLRGSQGANSFLSHRFAASGRLFFVAIGTTLIFAVSGSACFGQSLGHRCCCGRQEVFLIRGGAGYWPHVARFKDLLDSNGCAASIYFPWQTRQLANGIIRARRTGEMAGEVVIVGYSSGADAAGSVCRRLQQAGVPVATLVLVEPTLGPVIPANVRYCVNFYKSKPYSDWLPVFRGIAVRAESRCTCLMNLDVRHDRALAPLARYNHFTLADAPQMQSMLTGLIAARHLSTEKTPSKTKIVRTGYRQSPRSVRPSWRPTARIRRLAND